jgi:hypothetical protein
MKPVQIRGTTKLARPIKSAISLIIVEMASVYHPLVVRPRALTLFCSLTYRQGKDMDKSVLLRMAVKHVPTLSSHVLMEVVPFLLPVKESVALRQAL